jgi:hypothetical protein
VAQKERFQTAYTDSDPSGRTEEEKAEFKQSHSMASIFTENIMKKARHVTVELRLSYKTRQ